MMHVGNKDLDMKCALNQTKILRDGNCANKVAVGGCNHNLQSNSATNQDNLQACCSSVFFRSQLPVCCSTYASIHEKGMRNNKMPMAAVCLRFPTTACQLPIVTPSAACRLPLATLRQTRGAHTRGPIGAPGQRPREPQLESPAFEREGAFAKFRQRPKTCTVQTENAVCLSGEVA